MKKGFTLIEMLIVIAIIAILAGVFFVGAPGVMKKSRDSRRIADLKSVQSAIELYYSKCRFYPNSNSATDGSCGTDGAADIDWTTLENIMVNGDFGVTKLPKDPIATKTYYYAPLSESTGSSQGYLLGASLEVGGAAITTDSLTGVSVDSQSCGTGSIFCVGQPVNN